MSNIEWNKRAERTCSFINDSIRLGRLIALQKPSGEVCGIVVGNIMWVLARTMSHQFSKAVESTTAPFHHAMAPKGSVQNWMKRASIPNPSASTFSVAAQTNIRSSATRSSSGQRINFPRQSGTPRSVLDHSEQDFVEGNKVLCEKEGAGQWQQ